MKPERTYEDEDRVLAVLRAAGRPLAWSVIAARLYGVPRETVTLPQVRGVRDACRRLVGRGLAFDSRTGGATGPVALPAPRRGLVRFGIGPRSAA